MSLSTQSISELIHQAVNQYSLSTATVSNSCPESAGLGSSQLLTGWFCRDRFWNQQVIVLRSICKQSTLSLILIMYWNIFLRMYFHQMYHYRHLLLEMSPLWCHKGHFYLSQVSGNAPCQLHPLRAPCFDLLPTIKGSSLPVSATGCKHEVNDAAVCTCVWTSNGLKLHQWIQAVGRTEERF